MTDYPVGDGLPDCPKCKGRGVTTLPYDASHPIERTRICDCVLMRDVRLNVERGAPGLLAVESKPGPLKNYTRQNLWITAPTVLFRQHLKYVAVRQGPKWGFLCRNDADLMNAWLSSKKDEDVIDSDVTGIRASDVPDRHVDLEMMVIPPALLIIILGVKSARNSAMPEVLLEALKVRLYHNKPTWVVDQPGLGRFMDWAATGAKPHLSWSQAAQDLITEWPHIDLEKASKPRVKVQPLMVRDVGAPPMPTTDFSKMRFDEDETPTSTPVEVSPNTNKTTSLLSDLDAEKPEPKRGGFKKKGRS